ncbi:phosphopantetheine-binding protein [Corynebacterium sp.]|uniref:phosphopantetheine-binding protein n=1 Tax=Corynebacterium sp. TaxID=1720 RepID=UPI0026DAFE13|nr:phosphopantetheine-binding protein [Corynebacterium sp.]MDO4610595.1 thioesterase domain-containing protein [Corynebacterium sp.]
MPRLLAVADAIPLTGRGKRDAAASAGILRAAVGADPADDASATPGPDGGIDRAVRAVWARHVGDPDDGRSFVDAGADSLTAVAVRGALLRELGADVPLPAIVAGGVGELVDAVHRSRAGVAPGHVSSGRAVVRLRRAVASSGDVAEPSADTGVRWVFLPPMSGAVTRYLRLSRLLPAEHEVLACETARKDLESGFGAVVTAMADGICAAVPAGADVRVSGFSLGGVYARAVAVELAARGYARCSAHLIDPPDPGGHVTPERAAFLVFAQVGLAIPGDGARFLHGAVARGEVDEVREPDVDWGRLAQAAVASGMAAPGDSTDVLRDAWEVYRLNAGILAGFDAARYSGAEPPTRILVGADGEDIGYDGAVAERAAGGEVPVERIAPSGAWARLCPAATFDRLAVDHFALLDPPHDAAVARWLAGAPGAAEPRDGRP